MGHRIFPILLIVLLGSFIGLAFGVMLIASPFTYDPCDMIVETICKDGEYHFLIKNPDQSRRWTTGTEAIKCQD
jgi:hypothetical protein